MPNEENTDPPTSMDHSSLLILLKAQINEQLERMQSRGHDGRHYGDALSMYRHLIDQYHIASAMLTMEATSTGYGQ